jgi:hypothetical protein
VEEELRAVWTRDVGRWQELAIKKLELQLALQTLQHRGRCVWQLLFVNGDKLTVGDLS